VRRAAQLQQVLTNLVVNAVQASPESSTVEVGLRTLQAARNRRRLGTSRGPASCAITIADHGTGMGEDTLERVFEPFLRPKTWVKAPASGLP
jgi:signal transduction histidine kinase